GALASSETREYGPADLQILKTCPLFEGIAQEDPSRVWMSHGDKVKAAPAGVEVVGRTETLDIAAMADESRSIYALQFHPEVHHSVGGTQMINNFLFKIAKIKPDWTMSGFIESVIRDVREAVGPEGNVV